MEQFRGGAERTRPAVRAGRADRADRTRGARAACAVALAMAAVLTFAQCSGDDSSAPTPSSRARTPAIAGGSITVYATWNSAGFVTPLAKAFQSATKTKATVKFVPAKNLAGAAAVGKADVVVGAAPAIATAANRLRFVAAPRTIAADELVLVVPAGNPRQVRSLSVFGRRSGVRTVLCARGTFCRLASNQILRAVKVLPLADRELKEPAKIAGLVAQKQADAALVMRTTGAPLTPRLVMFRIPSPKNYRVEYRAGMVRGAKAQAAKFMKFLQGRRAVGLLRSQGYQAAKSLQRLGPPVGTVVRPRAKVTIPGSAITPKMRETIKRTLLRQARRNQR